MSAQASLMAAIRYSINTSGYWNRLTGPPSLPAAVTRTANGRGWSTLSWYQEVKEFYASRTVIEFYDSITVIEGYVMYSTETYFSA